MKNHIRIWLTTFLVGLPAAAYATPLVVFAASSTKNAVDESLRKFAANTGHAAVASYASSSALARQIASGAPADIFLSANQQWMQYLNDNAHLRADTQVQLATNRLALIASRNAVIPAELLPVRIGMPLVGALGQTERFATGDPSHVPLGQYAVAALRKLNIWQVLQARTVPAGNARLALALVARSEAMLGIVYKSDVTAQAGVRELALIDTKWHPPIRYLLAVTARSRHSEANNLRQFLMSPPAQAIFAKHGFGG